MTSSPAKNSQLCPLHPRKGASRARWSILGAGLIARLLVLWVAATSYPHQWLYSRGIEMGLLANSLLRGQGYSSPFGGSTGPTAFIAPGYPTIIAAVFFFFGTLSFPSAVTIIALQILVSLLTIWLMMHIAGRILDDRTAILAGAFWAISLPLLWIPTIFWETSLSACALVAMIALALRCQRCPTRALWMLMGIFSAAVALINPALLPTLLAILGWTGWNTRKTGPNHLFLSVVVLVLGFAAWPIRNAYRFHAFIPLRSTVGFELWMGNRPTATGYLDESIFPMYNKQELLSYTTHGELAYVNAKSAVAKDYIRAHPNIFLAMSVRRFWRFWSGTGNLIGSPIYAMHAMLTSVLGLMGLGLLCKNKSFAFAALMALPLILFPLPYYITHAEFRYRLNIDPILTILAAYAVLQMVSPSRSSKQS